MNDPNYIAAKALLNLLPDSLAAKLCKQKLAGIENRKQTSRERVKKYKDWLDTK